MSRDVPSTDFEQVTFGRTLFGYDPEEVRAFVEEAGKRIAELSELVHGGPSQPQAVDDYHLSQAKEEAMALRKAAWEAALAMLESAGAEVASMRSQAEQEALEIIDEAERRAVRNRVAARRDSKNTLANARAEHDRLVDMAKRLSQEIMAGKVTDERPDGEEWAQMMAGTTRYPVVSIPSIPPSEADENATIRIIHPVEAEEAELKDVPRPAQENGGAYSPVPNPDWADGSRTIRVVETSPPPSKDEVDGVEMAREVASLKAVQAEQESKEPEAHPDYPPQKPAVSTNGHRRRSRETRPVATPNREIRENGRANENGQALEKDSSVHDELTRLFTRLRELAPR